MPKFRVSTRTTCFHCHCVERLLNSLAETTHNAKTPTYRPNNKHYVLSNLAEPKACPKLKCSCCYVIKSCLASAFSGVQMQHWMQNLIFNGFTLDLLQQWRRFHAVAVMQLLFMPSFIFVHGEHAQWVHLLPFKFQQTLFRARWNWNTFKKYFVFSSTAPENCHCMQVKTHQYHIYEQNYWWIGGH